MANWAAVSPQNFRPSRDGSDLYVMINNNFVLTARPHDGCPQGEIGLTDAQRTWIGVTIGPQEIVQVQPYDPFRAGEQTLGSIDAEVGFATNKKTTDVPYDQDELAKQFTRVSPCLHILASLANTGSCRILRIRSWLPGRYSLWISRMSHFAAQSELSRE